jgi:hypothetical protein
MKDLPVLCLALFDFVPNLAFLFGAYYLAKIVFLVRGKACGGLTVVGTALIFLGGILQAIWKLLYVTETADLRLMSNLQFILLAPGFLMVLIAVILLIRKSTKKDILPVIFMAAWKLPFLIIMAITSLAAHGLLTFISIRRRSYWAASGFGIAFICLLGMSGMAGGDQTIPQQWVEESVNAIGQTSFALGSYLLYQHFVKFGCSKQEVSL